MTPAILLTPLRGDYRRNRAYADACLADSIERGEAPMILHFELARVLDDNDPEKREKGLAIARAFYRPSHQFIACCDLSHSVGIKGDESHVFTRFRLLTERRFLSIDFGIALDTFIRALDAGCVHKPEFLRFAAEEAVA